MDFGLLFPFLHQSDYDSLVLVANLTSQVPYVGKLPCRLQTHNLEGGRSHHSLFLVIGQWDPIKHLEQSKVAWPRLVLWDSMPCMVCQKMRLGAEKW